MNSAKPWCKACKHDERYHWLTGDRLCAIVGCDCLGYAPAGPGDGITLEEAMARSLGNDVYGEGV